MVRKSLADLAFPLFRGTAVADVNGASHLFITGKIDFILIGLTQDYSILIKIAKRKPELKQAMIQWHTDIYIPLRYNSQAILRSGQCFEFILNKTIQKNESRL